MTTPKNIYRELAKRCNSLTFSAPTAYVYNPLNYAQAPHESYLKRYGNSPKEVLLLGMNPGPWGMAQTGVPFGQVAAVRDWMGIDDVVKEPLKVHPKRPIQGFNCPRSEVSGARLWGLAAEKFADATMFFKRFMVLNYCPLIFLEDSGRNRTPDKLPVAEREKLQAACDEALQKLILFYQPKWVIGVGVFAEKRLQDNLKVMTQTRLLSQQTLPHCGRILHPSPASPAANKGWAEAATKQFSALGITL